MERPLAQASSDREQWLMQQPVAVLRAHAEECNANVSTCTEKREMVQQILRSERSIPSQPSRNSNVDSTNRHTQEAADAHLAQRLQTAEIAHGRYMRTVASASTPGDFNRGTSRSGYASSQSAPTQVDRRLLQQAFTQDEASLNRMAQQGYAVDYGSTRDQQRRIANQRQRMQADQAAMDVAWSRQMAYDFGRPDHTIRPPPPEHLPQSRQTRAARQMGQRSQRETPHAPVIVIARPVGSPQSSQASARGPAMQTFPRGPMFFVQTENSADQAMRGVDATTVAAATNTMTYRSMSGAESSDERTVGSENALLQCSVCLEAFQSGEELRVLPCLHRYHRCCIDRWLSQNAACPICKHRIVSG